ncbi:MAG: hypothetical protein P4L55_20595, partial [Syntrophobacteraceae bacterium]|nr:hypothetical protein [Syntrophobacteraceae bacterium]
IVALKEQHRFQLSRLSQRHWDYRLAREAVPLLHHRRTHDSPTRPFTHSPIHRLLFHRFTELSVPLFSVVDFLVFNVRTNLAWFDQLVVSLRE